ncbi:hypothetical protein AVEN_11539-1 [Araneus ventricosus]|uniref:Uncharacterized protein n=1 Tax=Araneus ventricosus TaxID=182803 RepID=A0A4Y2UU43_ARAVE|nr:hypothetical protein AVEN_11539-1 [Araneus ventricosus]
MRTSEVNTKSTSKRFNDQLSLNELRARLRRLDQLFKEFDQYGAALPEKASETEEFEAKYFETGAMYQSALVAFTVRSTTITNLTAFEASFKFPRSSIPRFDCKYNDWLNFEDLYLATVS